MNSQARLVNSAGAVLSNLLHQRERERERERELRQSASILIAAIILTDLTGRCEAKTSQWWLVRNHDRGAE